MTQKRMFTLLALFVTMALLVTGCGGTQSAQSDNKGPVKIGFFAPVTGPAAADGESVLNAAKLAVETINNDGGINGRKVELVNYDDALDSKQAVSIAQKLTTKDGVVAVVSGSYSGTTRASAKIYQDAKIPMISAYALHPDITKTGNYMFRQSFVGPVQGKAGAKVAVDMLNAKKISILQVDIDFGKTLAAGFTEKAQQLGAEIISVDSFSTGEKEFTPVLTKIKQLNPDLIYIPGYAAECSQIVRQAKELGITAKILGTEGADSTVQFLGVAKDAANGVIITTNMNRDSDRKLVQDFIKDYNQKYGYKPDMVAASTYDAFMVLANVMKTKGTEPDTIRQGLTEVKDYEAVTGLIKGYNQLGEVKKSVQVQIVKDAEFHYFGEISDDDIITPPSE
ncbi:ABC transporter substrate-binding protein [Sporomusa termitida]|uniref:Urea ABC transporter, urea binding protein n=1 Tax=Sporomusa termitida TaxID=2377 RepID=A0A517DP51_9FIRM|nr:ABC transporter substrate-binding protein [Sporomusa termitida]QDR79144.1 urea ABC transporter, urea binding protein [Sporomusa termitida]